MSTTEGNEKDHDQINTVPPTSSIDEATAAVPPVEENRATIEPKEAIVDSKPESEHQAHSVFTSYEKKIIVIVASLASAFSPWTSNIYYPALNTMADDLHTTSAKINLTITTYMVFQGVIPTFIGSLGDSAGRRPAYMFCFIVFILSNIALALQNSYAGLIVLRCFQSVGISGTVALASGVVADVATSGERGEYIGYTSVATVFAPAIGPVVGGLLSQYLGWKSIFWFLTIFAAVVFIPILLFFPETCRKIVGDGSITPPALNRNLLDILMARKKRVRDGETTNNGNETDDAPTKKQRLSFLNINPMAALRIAVAKEEGLLLMYGGFIYAGFYAITTSTPSQFHDIYNFNEVQVSLLYIPLAVGSLASSFTNGRFIDMNYRRHAAKQGIPLETLRSRQQDMLNFPVEKARLEVCVPLSWAGSLIMVAFGWVLHYHTHISGPVILLFFLGYFLVGSFNTMTVLIVDMNRDRPATAMAAMGLVRCTHGAVATAIIAPMIDAMGSGWTFTFWGLLCFCSSPLLWVIMRWGPGWRKENRAKRDARKKKKIEKRAAEDVEKGRA